MTDLFDLVSVADVSDAWSFASYAQQQLGTPLPSGKDRVILNTRLKAFWEQNPRATWRVLALTVDWCKAKKRRPATSWGVLPNFRWAWADGTFELDEYRDEAVERGIAYALEMETDPSWRQTLLGCSGKYRGEVLHEWKRERS